MHNQTYVKKVCLNNRGVILHTSNLHY